MMIKNFPKEELLSFLKIFVFCFAVVFLVINLGTIKRMFDYKLVYGEIINSLKGEEPQSTEVSPVSNEPKIVLTEKKDSIEIPKINIEAPLVFVESAEKSVFSKALDRGVVHYPESALPGEKGQIIFLGHSAPPGWPKIKHDWVFSELGDLVLGDKIYLYYNQQKYTFSVKEKVVLDKGEELPENDLRSSESTLILLSCWPPGADRRRIAVIAEP